MFQRAVLIAAALVALMAGPFFGDALLAQDAAPPAPTPAEGAPGDALPAEPTPVPFPGKLTGEWFVPALTCLFCDSMVGQEIQLDQAVTILKYYDRMILEPTKGSGTLYLKSEKVDFDLTIRVDTKTQKLILLYFEKGVLPRVGESFAHVYVLKPTGNDQLLYGEAYQVNIYDDAAFLEDPAAGKWRANQTYFDEIRVLALLEDVRVTTLDEDRRLFVASQSVRVSLEGAAALFRLEITPEDLAAARASAVEALKKRAERVALFRTLVASGDQLYTQGDYDAAAGQYQAAAGLRPGEAIIYANLGAIHQMQKKYIEAERNYTIARDLSPNDPDILFNLGAIAEGQRQWERAKDLYERVLRLTPDDMDAQERLKVVSGMAR